jgi:YVTN family beta-propeller protein
MPTFYFACQGRDSVAFLDPSSLQVIDTVAVHAGPVAIRATTKSELAVVAHCRAGTVSVLDVAKRRVIGNLQVGKSPISIAILN